jgi:hypothetical protein
MRYKLNRHIAVNRDTSETCIICDGKISDTFPSSRNKNYLRLLLKCMRELYFGQAVIINSLQTFNKRKRNMRVSMIWSSGDYPQPRNMRESNISVKRRLSASREICEKHNSVKRRLSTSR